MPVVIAEADRDAWLDRRLDGRAASELIPTAPTPLFSCRPVSTRVNRPSEDDAGLLEEVGP
jgi:putative SOS response-associated peptidase YedK